MEAKRTFNNMVAENELDELLEATRKLCNHKISVQNIKLPTYIDREDVMQDAMLKVFRAYERFDPTKASANTYFTRIVENTIIDHIRHSQTQHTVNDISGVSDAYGTGILRIVDGNGVQVKKRGMESTALNDTRVKDLIHGSSLEEQLLTELMLDLDEMLTERELQIFSLRYEGYTHEEIAEKIGVSRPTVAKDWVRVRKIVLDLIY